ncbi:GntR family transcriptional regulator [Acrocarpospora sp. B8E8]|uniref:GntR family transcriptional regulator n=1 Tax=Acrocarpospora sp. B8E8 TaxID=3153572 RepID=UPI00325FA94E
MIKNGDLVPGEKVPSEDELSGVFGVARATARSAHRELRECGLAHTAAGAGTIVGLRGTATGSDVRPLYLRVAREIADQIQDGGIAPDRPIPTRLALVARYGVSVETARRAVGMLRGAGWVYTVADGRVSRRGRSGGPRRRFYKGGVTSSISMASTPRASFSGP